ncbi:MAG: YibE/F family protein [Clostridia bacterium]|nr:YibE/F family protein [Clostridia bacterium]
MKKKLHSILLVTIVLLIPIIVLISGWAKEKMSLPSYYDQDFEEAKILLVKEESLTPNPVVEGLYNGKQTVFLEILTGKYKGETQEVVNTIDQSHNVVTYKGQKVIVGIRETDEGFNAWIYSYKRAPSLYLLGILFVGLMLYFGRKKGLDAIVALAFTTTVLIFIMVPMIFNGYNPIIVTIFSVFVSSLVSFILIGGFQKKTYIAIIGTLMGVVTAGIIALTFGKMTHITGLNLDQGSNLSYMALDYNIKIRGLMFASILIASMGAVMDVSMSIASSMSEIVTLQKHISFKKLFQSGMNIGKDIMGTMANTLILAFMGGSLSLMLLLWGYNMSLRQLINMPFISVEVVQGIAGSIGIVLTVPFTALVAAFVYKKQQ